MWRLGVGPVSWGVTSVDGTGGNGIDRGSGGGTRGIWTGRGGATGPQSSAPGGAEGGRLTGRSLANLWPILGTEKAKAANPIRKIKQDKAPNPVVPP